LGTLTRCRLEFDTLIRPAAARSSGSLGTGGTACAAIVSAVIRQACSTDTGSMSLAAAGAQTQDAIEHIQSLFNRRASPTDAADEAAVRLSQAPTISFAGATTIMAASSGHLVGNYLPFSDRRATGLVDAAFTDQSLGAHVKAAAAIAQQGAAQMDAIAASAQQTYSAAGGC
jgi:hypothetical protein